MSVYPAGVKQHFRSTLTEAEGTGTLINHPCVVKYISACPTSFETITNFYNSDSVVLYVYDGTTRIIAMAGSGNANYSCSNSSILIPADGLKIKNYLAMKCEHEYGSGTTSENKYANISVVYQ